MTDADDGETTMRRRRRLPSEEPTSQRRKKVDDDLQAFTHFLLGKNEMDENEKEELVKQQNDRELIKLLEMKEKQEK